MPNTDVDSALIGELEALQRPGQAVQNILDLNLTGGYKALLQPEQLTPLERDAFLKKLGLDKGPFARVFRGMLNPALIIGVALSYKFPVPTAEQMFKVSKKLGGLTAKFPLLGRLLSGQALYRGTSVMDDVGQVVRDVHDWRSRYGGEFATALTKFKQRMGRFPTQKEQILVGAYLDGLHKPLLGYQAGKRGLIRVGSGELAKDLEPVGILFPNLEKRMSPQLRKLADDYRGTLRSMWEEQFGDPAKRARLAQALRRSQKADLTTEMDFALEEWIKHPREIAHYFPHKQLMGDLEFQQIVSALTATGKDVAYKAAMRKRMMTVVGSEHFRRRMGLVPDFEDLKLVSEYVDQKQVNNLTEILRQKVISRMPSPMTARKVEQHSLETFLKNPAKVTNQLSPLEVSQFASALSDVNLPGRYSLKLTPVISQYVHSTGAAYGWTVRDGGSKLMQHVVDLKNAAETGLTGFPEKFPSIGKIESAKAVAARRLHMLENTYIPMALGRGSYRQALKAQSWDAGLLQMGEWLKEHGEAARKIMGPKLFDLTLEGLSKSKGPFSFLNLQRKAAGYFYLSTLGANPSSAMKNLLQLVLTTGPTVGFRTASEGALSALRKSHKYFSLRLGTKRLSHDAALRAAYPEFAETGLVASPITEEAIQNSLQNAYGIATMPTGKLASVGQKVQRALMSVFSASENAVRLSTFEAGLLHAKRTGLKGRAVQDFAAKLVEQTQFLSGPQNTPYFLLEQGPVVKQLGQFPMRMLEFATSTAVTMGSESKNILGYNPGTFGRMIAGSMIAMEVGDAVGVNLRDALVGSAVPTFTEPGKVLAPLPVVPPALQIAGALGFAAQGDFTELVHSTPLMFPGGVSLSRAMGLLPPGVPGSGLGQAAAQKLGRTYADYQAPAPDGRIAVFSGAGSLRGYFTPWEIVKSGMGVRSGDMESEQRLLHMLTTQRDQIQEYRSAYLDARLKNDASKASRIATEFQRRYGFPIPVTDQHMKAVQLRRSMSRLERMVQQMPAGPAREGAVQLASQFFGSEGSALFGLPPSQFGESNAVRARSRRPLPQRTPYLNQLGPTDTVDSSNIGRQKLPPMDRYNFP